jgi:hypothetical protein
MCPSRKQKPEDAGRFTYAYRELVVNRFFLIEASDRPDCGINVTSTRQVGAADDVLYGHQEDRFFHGYYDWPL